MSKASRDVSVRTPGPWQGPRTRRQAMSTDPLLDLGPVLAHLRATPTPHPLTRLQLVQPADQPEVLVADPCVLPAHVCQPAHARARRRALPVLITHQHGATSTLRCYACRPWRFPVTTRHRVET